MKNITNENEAWMAKFEFLVQRLKTLVSQEGKELVLVNVEAGRDPKKQFDKYMQAVELVRDKVECVVSTSLPGEERIFWPFYDVQFYIRDDKEAISSTGNSEIIQRVFSVDDREVNATLPGMDYWKGKEFVYQLDPTDYIGEQRLLTGEIELNSQEILEKFGYRHVKPFENEDWWYILKFFFVASEFNNLDGFGELIGGVPKELKIKCECQNLLDVEFFWKGIFKVPEQSFEHQYYLYVSHECESCGKTICLYRPRGPLCPHLIVFMNHLAPERNLQMILRRVIDNLLPIIRFIDEKIIISYEKYNYKGRDIYQFFDESGIILFNSFETEYTGDYPHENNYWDYFGYQIVLTRSGKVLRFSRAGTGSAWQQDSSSWKSTSEEISLKELISLFSLSEILESFAAHFDKAIEHNKKKFAILEKRYDIINSIIDSLESA